MTVNPRSRTWSMFDVPADIQGRSVIEVLRYIDQLTLRGVYDSCMCMCECVVGEGHVSMCVVASSVSYIDQLTSSGSFTLLSVD